MKVRWAPPWQRSDGENRKGRNSSLPFLGIFLAAVPLAWSFWIVKADPYLSHAHPCLFREVSGYACPGCGFTRATYSFLTGDWERIASMNAGFPLFGSLWIWCVLMLLNRRPLLSHRFDGAVTNVLCAAVLVFGVVRNFPGWPLPLPN